MGEWDNVVVLICDLRQHKGYVDKKKKSLEIYVLAIYIYIYNLLPNEYK